MLVGLPSVALIMLWIERSSLNCSCFWMAHPEETNMMKLYSFFSVTYAQNFIGGQAELGRKFLSRIYIDRPVDSFSWSLQIATKRAE